MDQEVSKARLKQQLATLLAFDAIVEYHDWKFEIDELFLFVTMRPRPQPEKKYLARFTFDDYPQRAPSFAFVDMETKEVGKEFWPQHGSAFGSAVSRQPPQLCIAGVREFHEQLHQEQHWDANRFPLGLTLEAIQAELDSGHPSA